MKYFVCLVIPCVHLMAPTAANSNHRTAGLPRLNVSDRHSTHEEKQGARQALADAGGDGAIESNQRWLVFAIDGLKV